MPFALLAGVPWLAGVITAAFIGIFTWFLQFLTKRLAFTAAAIVLIAGLTAGLFAGLEALLSTISLVVPPEITQLSGVVLPSNLSQCMSVVITGYLLKYAYSWNVKIIQMKLF